MVPLKAGKEECDVYGQNDIRKKVIQMKKDVFLYFKDYEKVFDKVRHKHNFEQLGKHDLLAKYIRITQHIYREYISYRRLQNE